jgi:hypothetical protein
LILPRARHHAGGEIIAGAESANRLGGALREAAAEAIGKSLQHLGQPTRIGDRALARILEPCPAEPRDAERIAGIKSRVRGPAARRELTRPDHADPAQIPGRIVERLKMMVLEILGGDLLGPRLPISLHHMRNPQVAALALTLPGTRARPLRFTHRDEVLDEDLIGIIEVHRVFSAAGAVSSSICLLRSCSD